MQTRRDLYQAHRLMTQRLGMALLQGEPDVPESPMRRHNVATFCGVLVAVLVAVAFGIYGLLKPGGATALTEPGTVIVEEESGATFVYSATRGQMIPVANVTSARLLLGGGRAGTGDGPHGHHGLARALPPRAHGRHPRRPRVAAAPRAAGPRALVGLRGRGRGRAPGRVPRHLADRRLRRRRHPVRRDTAMVVEEGSQTWLLSSDRRMRVPQESLRALTEEQPRQVPAAWLNALPIGPDFSAPALAARGRVVRGPDGRRSVAGRIYTVRAVSGGAAKWYVLLPDGLAALTTAQAELLLQDPASKKAYGRAPVRAVEIDAATANGMRRSATRFDPAGLPATMPRVVPPIPPRRCARSTPTPSADQPGRG